MTLAEIKRSAGELNEEDRADLADFLLGTLETVENDVAEAWRAEAIRRMEEVDSGKEKGIPAEVVLQQLREMYP